MDHTTVVAVFIPLAALSISIFYELYARYKARHLPPGISGLRCIFEIPNEKTWVKMLEFNKQYGDIASGSLFGYNIIIIGSAKISEDLLEKRSTNYSDRPRSVMGGELSGWGKVLLLSNCNEWFRMQRKWIAQEIGGYTAVAKRHGMIEHETRRYLKCVLEDPVSIRAHLRKNLTSIILRLSHGYVTRAGTDPLVELVDVANSQLSVAIIPGLYYADLVPLMKYIPSWLPGAGFKRKAREYAVFIRDLVEIPHNYVKSQLAAGTALPSLSSRIMSKPVELTEELVDSIKWTAATMFHSGSDTTYSVSYAFYLAMTLHPRVMKKAQQELDSVVGTGRLPTFVDRPSLPYMEALYTELLRWHTPGPITMRCTRVDDSYNGHIIPAGSYVFANTWAMLRDERTYSNPTEFRPERFLGDNPEPHPGNISFGFGRRCPGYFLAHSTLWLMCVQALAVFDISKCIENGVEITPEVDLVGGVIAHQAPFKCSIKPRSKEAERLIREEFPLSEY